MTDIRLCLDAATGRSGLGGAVANHVSDDSAALARADVGLAGQEIGVAAGKEAGLYDERVGGEGQPRTASVAGDSAEDRAVAERFEQRVSQCPCDRAASSRSRSNAIVSGRSAWRRPLTTRALRRPRTEAAAWERTSLRTPIAALASDQREHCDQHRRRKREADKLP